MYLQEDKRVLLHRTAAPSVHRQIWKRRRRRKDNPHTALQRFGRNEPRATLGNDNEPQTRLLKQVTIENATVADEIFSMLMGDDVEPRREFIEENATYANIDA